MYDDGSDNRHTGRPFTEERKTATEITVSDGFPLVAILVASEPTMTYAPIYVLPDSGLQGGLTLSRSAWEALGSPEPTRTIRMRAIDGHVAELPLIRVDVVFGNLKFLDAPAALNFGIDKSFLGWSILRHVDYSYLHGQPGLNYNKPQTFVFKYPDELKGKRS